MPDRRYLKAAELAEEERQMNELNASMERDQKRRQLACDIAQEKYASGSDDDIETSDPDDNRGVLAVESVDGGYWVSARVWVYAEEVEERLEGGEK